MKMQINLNIRSLQAEYSEFMQEENALLAKKERLQARSDQELLKEEPANLQKAISDADSEKEQLLSDRQVKVRERNQLQAQRDLMTGDSSEYQKLGESISAKDNEIRQIDTQIQDCESRSYSASKALRAQENELRDRQAYNLGERVKAQQEYDTAAAELERYKTASGSGAKSQKKAAEAIAKRRRLWKTQVAGWRIYLWRMQGSMKNCRSLIQTEISTVCQIFKELRVRSRYVGQKHRVG